MASARALVSTHPCQALCQPTTAQSAGQATAAQLLVLVVLLLLSMQSVLASYAIGLHWGRLRPQNKKAHIVGHVKVRGTPRSGALVREQRQVLPRGDTHLEVHGTVAVRQLPCIDHTLHICASLPLPLPHQFLATFAVCVPPSALHASPLPCPYLHAGHGR